MKVDSLKLRLQELVGEVNATNAGCLKFHQQQKTEGNMSFIGGNGRLYVQPSSLGYDISLSGKSLEKEMYPFMRELCGSECTGYKQPNRSIGKKNQPFWRVESFELVKEAVYRYSKTIK